MTLAPYLEHFGTYWAQAERFFVAAPGIAVAGGLFFTLAIVTVAWLILKWSIQIFGGAQRSARAAKIRGLAGSGARILVANGGSGRERAIARFLVRAARQDVKTFMFGGPFIVETYPLRVGSQMEADALLNRTEADVLLWSETPKGNRQGTVNVHARQNRQSDAPPNRIVLAMPRKKAQWTDALASATAYAAVKQFRPALGRPQDFRPERLQPVVESLLETIDRRPEGDPQLLAILEDDATAGAVQLMQSDEPMWGERAIAIARRTLDGVDRTKSSDRWIRNKIALGRALRLSAERKFDPVVLREALMHLQEALEALRSEPRLRLAESAAQAINDAQRLLGGQRKFSITGGGV